MKKLEEIRSLLKDKKEYLRDKYGVKELAIFGSVSRGDIDEESDIDIMVDFEEPIGLAFVDLAEELEEILELKVDLVSKNGIKPKYLKNIKNDLVNV